MKYIAPKAELVLLETELIMWNSDDRFPDDDDSVTTTADAQVVWEE